MDSGLTPDCVPDDWFEEYLLGRLPEAKMAILEARLLVDEDCRLKLDEAEIYMAAMRGALQRAQNNPLPRQKRWLDVFARPLPLAGAALAAGALLMVVTLQYRAGQNLGPVSQTLTLNAERGSPLEAAARPGHLQLRLDLEGIPEGSHTVQVVTEAGAEVWSGPLRAAGEFAVVDVRLGSGQYLVRIQSGPEQLREFHLAVE